VKTKTFIYWLVMLLLVSCSTGQAGENGDEPQEITVFAAASLTEAFNELAGAFETQNEGVEVILNFAGSAQLAAQLSEGAPADVFASANPTQMQAVVSAGRIAAGSEKLFVSNRLTIITPADNPAEITALEDLARPGVQLILAVPGVPVRQYTDEIVAALPADFQAQLYGNLVSEEENVRQVAAKIALGEADAGIVYTSDVTPDIAGQVQQIPILDAQNVGATYPIAPLSDAPSPTLAQSFIDFVLSDEGQTILSRWGFGPPPAN
jgi:molybdate transport system substrate-binding protein